MREILTVTIVLAAIGTDLRFASAMTPHCEQASLVCIENTPPGQSAQHCRTAWLKCEWDALHNPDAITSAGRRVPRGEKPKKKPIYGPEDRAMPDAAAATNSATAKTTGGAASGGTLGASQSAAPASGATLSGSNASAASAIKSGITKPAAIPPQLAERLRRLQHQQQR